MLDRGLTEDGAAQALDWPDVHSSDRRGASSIWPP
jgi:hypothetical protein